MQNWDHMIVLETDADVREFLRVYRDKPKVKQVKPKGCMVCGADRDGGKLYCPKCAIKRIRASKNEYKKRQEKSIDRG